MGYVHFSLSQLLRQSLSFYIEQIDLDIGWLRWVGPSGFILTWDRHWFRASMASLTTRSVYPCIYINMTCFAGIRVFWYRFAGLVNNVVLASTGLLWFILNEINIFSSK